MTAKYPRFVPILGSYTTRVSGRDLRELLESPAALARALADTQHLVGHDCILCFYAPRSLVKSCLNASGSLCAADDAARSGSIAAVLEATAALRTLVPAGVQVFACFPGPALMLGELRRICPSNSPELFDYDYVSDVFLNLVRAGCEAGAHGVAVVENVGGEECVPESCFRSARKLVDFYSKTLLVFLEPGCDAAPAFSIADFIVRLPKEPGKLELVVGAPSDLIHDKPVMTTNKDVPVEVSVEDLRALRALAMQ